MKKSKKLLRAERAEVERLALEIYDRLNGTDPTVIRVGKAKCIRRAKAEIKARSNLVR